jgi:hypothetical protein
MICVPQHGIGDSAKPLGIGVRRAFACVDKAGLTIVGVVEGIRSAHDYAGAQCPQFGYLLTCLRTGAWRAGVCSRLGLFLAGRRLLAT